MKKSNLNNVLAVLVYFAAGLLSLNVIEGGAVWHALGVVFFISGLYGIIERFRLKKQIKILESASRERDKELNSLRNLPITSDDVGSGQANSMTEPG